VVRYIIENASFGYEEVTTYSIMVTFTIQKIISIFECLGITIIAKYIRYIKVYHGKIPSKLSNYCLIILYIKTIMALYSCEICNYSSARKTNYERHLISDTHKRNYKTKSLYCDTCDMYFPSNSQYIRHLQTSKHAIRRLYNNNITTPTIDKYTCEYCEKGFKYKSGLSRHTQTCKKQDNDRDNSITISRVTDILEQQQTIFGEQQTMMSEIMAKVTENCSITNITNNTTNNNDNKFNLNIFLNETCKNAMTLEHFLNNLQIEIEDIEYVGNHGYVEGMSHIITERLNALDITERPIHCTDMKRETMHIKCEDAWHKDVDDEKINSLVGIVAKLNYRKLPDWREQHPHFLDSSNPDFDYHMKMLGNILGAQQNTSIDKKVIKNIAKHTALDKPRLAMKYK